MPCVSPLRLVLLDDHPLFGVGLAHALRALDPAVHVQAAPTFEDAVQCIVLDPGIELVLVDLNLRDAAGDVALRRLGERFPHLPRLLISGDESAAAVQRARMAGACGFIGKSLTAEQMLQRLRAAQQGDAVFPAVPEPAPASSPLAPGASSASASNPPTLRQLEVLALLSQGLSNKEIAKALAIAERTVKLHVTALLERLQAANRTQLALLAREQGWV